MALRSYSKMAFRASALLVGASTASLYTAEQTGSDSGLVRSFRFWKGAVPIYAHYKYVEWSMRNEKDASTLSNAYQPLHEKYSPTVESLTLQLKGFYFKLAQIVSTRDDFLADEYLAWTKKLQDKSASLMPSEQVRDIVQSNLHAPIEDLFSEWDDEPIGSASIAQVHRARLLETGQQVAVKVQFPGIENKFRNDIDTVEMFCKYLMPQNTAYFAEIKRQFATEFDFRGEAENLRLVHDNLHRAGWDKLVEVPEPIHSTKHVLVMTYLPGPKFVDGVREQFRRVAETHGKDLETMEREQKELVRSGQVEKKDVREKAAESQRLERLLATRNYAFNALIFLANWTIRPLIRSEKWPYVKSEAPLNLGAILNTLLLVHAHEIFVDGAFNGDPHPGNILLMPDGRLGLVDYGQVKRLGVEERIVYAKLIVALSRDDRAEVVRIMKDEIGFRTKYMKDDIIFRTAAFFNCRDSEDILQGMNVSQFMEWLEEQDPVTHINDEYVMVGRVSILMRGMANAFGMKLSVSQYWQEEASNFLKSQGINY